MKTDLRDDRPATDAAPNIQARKRPGSIVLVCEAQAVVSDALREVLHGVPGVWRASPAASVPEARREAARLHPDVAIVTTFGPNTLERFTVWTDEIAEGEMTRAAS